MTSREDLIREALELEAEFLDDLGETDEAAKVRARIPRTDAELKARERAAVQGGSEVYRTPSGKEYAIVNRRGRIGAWEIKTGRKWPRKRTTTTVPVKDSGEEIVPSELIDVDEFIRIERPDSDVSR
ncbi:hypothetical protein MRBLWH7_000336 [Microbacterium sp. LWH7-1.2]|uniref:hypothetical protein n=1 Tax=Microbacterium sp. LWH7-1.2 TaxID=3135257 RepID=UPI00313A38CF